MSELAKRECIACEKGGTAMSWDEAERHLADLPEWKLGVEAKAIHRKFTFKNFKQALEFVNRLGEVAEEAFHHPDIALGWGYVEVTYQTHSINGLHINDFIMAARTEELAQ